MELSRERRQKNTPENTIQSYKNPSVFFIRKQSNTTLKVFSATTQDQFPFIHLFRFPLHSLPMAKPSIIPISLFLAAMAAVLIPIPAEGLMPYTRNLWDMVLPFDDPFRILEHSPITVPKGLETIALARSDWKETTSAHIITLDVPGMKKEDIKIEIEENRVLRISGERTAEGEAEGEKWHRSERATGKFWRQFRLPANADLDRIKAHLENGVLRITIPKLAEDRKKQAKVVNIAEETNSGEDVMATKSEM